MQAMHRTGAARPSPPEPYRLPTQGQQSGVSVQHGEASPVLQTPDLITPPRGPTPWSLPPQDTGAMNLKALEGTAVSSSQKSIRAEVFPDLLV